MTLPEHAICSVMLAQFGVRQRYGWPGVAIVTAAGLAPDLDAATKLFGDHYFWSLHHALGHSLVSIAVLSCAIAGIGACLFMGAFKVRTFGDLLAWCLIAALVHCLTDALYWWGIFPLWPISRWEVRFGVIEYLDLIVLAICLGGAVCLYRWRTRGAGVAAVTLLLFAGYVAIRAVTPEPTGLLALITGQWMYGAPRGTPVLDWW